MQNYLNIISEVFPIGTEEYRILEDAHNLIISSTPQISAEYKNKMITLDRVRAELSSLYFMVSRNMSNLKSGVQKDYDAKYTHLVKVGRPSNTAIEAEIRLTNPDYVVAFNKIEELDTVRTLITSYIKCIDSCKNTTIELLKDSRRID